MKTFSLIFFLSCLFFINATAEEHPPYASNKCFSCHKKGEDGKPIKNAFIANQPDLCYKCHDRQDEGKVVHEAVTGKCTACHSPHESDNPAILKKPISEGCVKCHESPNQDAANQHTALIMTKSCVRCHSPHSSNNKKLLIDKTTKLCTYCHTDIAKGMAEPTNTVHEAVNMGCNQCHDSHGSENSRLLKQNPNDLCYKCHEVEKFGLGHPRAGHPTIGKPDPLYPEKPFTCVSCHKPHFSANKKLIRYNFTKAPYNGSLCNVCHWADMMPPPVPPTPDWD